MKAVSYRIPFQTGRVRLKVMPLFGKHLFELEALRIELAKQYAEKDEKTGEPITTMELTEKGIQETFKMTDANRAIFDKELIALMMEDCLVDIPESLEKSMGIMVQIVNNTPVEFDDRETVVVEMVMDALRGEKPIVEKEDVVKQHIENEFTKEGVDKAQAEAAEAAPAAEVTG